MNRLIPPALITFCLLTICSCRSGLVYHVIPAEYVYSIVEHNDSLYCSTQSGMTFRLHPGRPDSVTRLGLQRFLPLRTLGFLSSGDLLASSYEGGVYRILDDTLTPVPGIRRMAWSMKIDANDNIWLAGKQGVFRQMGDTLLRVTGLSEAYDVDFYRGRLAVAHRDGITFYDSSTGVPERTLCKGTICWSIDVVDPLLIGTGVETCVLVNDPAVTSITIGPKHNLPWAAVRDTAGTVYLATQRGLFRILPGKKKAECIGFKGKCIKSVCIDQTGRLWVGKYFKP